MRNESSEAFSVRISTCGGCTHGYQSLDDFRTGRPALLRLANQEHTETGRCMLDTDQISVVIILTLPLSNFVSLSTGLWQDEFGHAEVV